MKAMSFLASPFSSKLMAPVTPTVSTLVSASCSAGPSSEAAVSSALSAVM